MFGGSGRWGRDVEGLGEVVRRGEEGEEWNCLLLNLSLAMKTGHLQGLGCRG